MAFVDAADIGDPPPIPTLRRCSRRRSGRGISLGGTSTSPDHSRGEPRPPAQVERHSSTDLRTPARLQPLDEADGMSAEGRRISGLLPRWSRHGRMAGAHSGLAGIEAEMVTLCRLAALCTWSRIIRAPSGVESRNRSGMDARREVLDFGECDHTGNGPVRAQADSPLRAFLGVGFGIRPGCGADRTVFLSPSRPVRRTRPRGRPVGGGRTAHSPCRSGRKSITEQDAWAGGDRYSRRRPDFGLAAIGAISQLPEPGGPVGRAGASRGPRQ